jgi:hypothetical protein
LVLRDSSFFGDCPTLGRPFDTAGEAFDELCGVRLIRQKNNAMAVSRTLAKTIGNAMATVFKVGESTVADVAEEDKIQKRLSQTVRSSKFCFVFFQITFALKIENIRLDKNQGKQEKFVVARLGYNAK